MRRGSIRSLGSGLSRLVNSMGGREHADKAAIVAVWEKSVGLDVARHTYVRGIRRGELLIAVDSPVWATQLQAMSEDLRARLNEEIGKELVRSTRFTVSRAVSEENEKARREADAARGYGGSKVEPAPLNETEMEQAQGLVANIQEPALREAALKALVAEKEWEKGARLSQETRRPEGLPAELENRD